MGDVRGCSDAFFSYSQKVTNTSPMLPLPVTVKRRESGRVRRKGEREGGREVKLGKTS